MIKRITFGALVSGLVIAGNTFAQAMPATDLWLASIENGVPVNPVKINTGSGYNNQPHFSGDGSVIYYTRETPGEDSAAQTDIAAFNIKTTTTTMVNQTSESEYSPTPIPGRSALSVIQVEPDQKQRLWAIDINSGAMELLLPGVEPVGYHAWINDKDVAMFILGDTFTLQIGSLDSDDTRLAADNIGRSIRRHPATGEVLFVDKNREPWQIAAFDPDANVKRSVMPLFPGNEDFTIDHDGNYWTGNGSKLYKRSPSDRNWKLVADFRAFQVSHITRLAIHLESGRIAFVSDHEMSN